MTSSDRPEPPPSDSSEPGPLPTPQEEATPTSPEEWAVAPAHPPVPSTRLVLGVVLLVIGIMWLLGVTNVVEVSPLPLLDGALIVVGLTLLVGSRTGRHSGLIALGIVLTVVLAAASTFDIRLSGGVGQRTFTPHSLADLDRRYDLAIGQLTIDLRDIQVGSSLVVVEARVGVGELVVLVPAVPVDSHGRAGLGQVTILGRADSGFDVDLSVPSSHPSGTGSLGLELSVGIGQVTVDEG
jgi:hypothetical protein